MDVEGRFAVRVGRRITTGIRSIAGPADRHIDNGRLRKVDLCKIGVDAQPWEVADLCTVYSWPVGLAGGGVIALVEFAGGWLQSDASQGRP
ncbi:MAG TPA: hypothetical protein VGG86_01885 [Roseiarcus sp.]